MQPCRWQEPRHLLQPSLLPPLTCTNQQEAGTGCQSLGSNPSTAVSGIIKLSALDFTLSLFVCLSLYSFTFVFITVLEAIHPGFYAHYHIFKSVFAPTGSQPSLHHNHLADNLTFTTKSDDCGLIHWYNGPGLCTSSICTTSRFTTSTCSNHNAPQISDSVIKTWFLSGVKVKLFKFLSEDKKFSIVFHYFSCSYIFLVFCQLGKVFWKIFSIVILTPFCLSSPIICVHSIFFWLPFALISPPHNVLLVWLPYYVFIFHAMNCVLHGFSSTSYSLFLPKNPLS